MKKLLFIAAALFWTSSSSAGEGDIEIAKRFLKALESKDLVTAETLMAEDITFEDPTWSHDVHRGKETMKEVYRYYTSGTQNIQSHLMSVFESNGTVVLNYMFYVELEIEPGNAAAGTVPMMGAGMRIVGVRDGKVYRHMDLADYDIMKETVAQARAE